jgi:hypothetical protein
MIRENISKVMAKLEDVHHCVEQLDLSAKQLLEKQSSFYRFSLILTDNALELMLHRFAESKFHWDEFLSRMGKSEFSDKEKKDVLGNSFEEKVRFAKRLNIISEQQTKFILTCHRYRNELYHQGLKHEGIIGDIAWHYHELACELIPKLQTGGYSFSGLGDNLSTVVKKYCGEKGLMFGVEKKMDEAFKLLAREKAPLIRSFAETLYISAFQRVKETDDCIDYLEKDSPKKLTRAQVILDVQAWPFLFTDEGKNFIFEKAGPKVKSIQDCINFIEDHWKPPVVKDPISSWKKRCESIKNEKCFMKAFEKYCSFMDSTERFYNEVCRSAEALGNHIDEMIDRMREK